MKSRISKTRCALAVGLAVLAISACQKKESDNLGSPAPGAPASDATGGLGAPSAPASAASATPGASTPGA